VQKFDGLSIIIRGCHR